MLISRFPNNNAEERITELEKQYNISLPQLYRDFLCKYNGGNTPNTDYKAGRASTVIRGFYGFGDVEFSFDKMKLDSWLEKNILPIACDPFGNEIVIGLSEERYGKIYFCDHEKGYSKKLVGEDFKAFIKKCKSKKIDPDTKMSIAEREAMLIARGRGHVIDDGLRKIWQDEIDKYGNMVQEEIKI